MPRKIARGRRRGQALEKSSGCGSGVADSQNRVSALRRRQDVRERAPRIPTAVNSTLRRVPYLGGVKKCSKPEALVARLSPHARLFPSLFRGRSRNVKGRMDRGGAWLSSRVCARLCAKKTCEQVCLKVSETANAKNIACRNACQHEPLEIGALASGPVRNCHRP
jgi:hypothetical protein